MKPAEMEPAAETEEAVVPVKRRPQWRMSLAVSYTHLTLPTM